MTAIRLVPVEEKDFASLMEAVVAPYSVERATADRLTLEEGEADARRQLAAFLPQGRSTPGHAFFWIETESGRAGHVWYRIDPVRQELFLCHIFVRPERRRQGLAAAALRRVEADARAAGCRRLSLNVFAPNSGAIALYSKLGFAVVSQHMHKPL